LTNNKKNNTSFKKGHNSFALKNEVGKRYGKLIVVKRLDNTRFGNARWLCECDCGNFIERVGSSLRRGESTSCSTCVGKDRRGGETPLKRMYTSYRCGAIGRKITFDLSFEQFKEIVSQKCSYCGHVGYEHFAYHRTRYSDGISTDEKLVFNGIDRIDNTRGYITNNVVPCCKICNRMKSDLSFEEFKNKIAQIVKYMVIT